MSKCSVILATLSLTLFSTGRTLAQDPTMQPVTKSDLIKVITNTPLDSLKHGEIINRAYASGLAEVAYEQYTLLWKQHPKDIFANLRKGGAAENYWQYATRPDIHTFSVISPSAKRLFREARSCLSFAQEQAPNSVQTDLAYGYFLFWHDSQMEQGVHLMKKALSLDPNSAAAHRILGDAYAEESGKVYNPQNAVTELTLASSLDKSSAFPHWRLVRVYLDLHQYQAAQRELQAYVSLVPPEARRTKWVRGYQSTIDAGLATNREH